MAQTTSPSARKKSPTWRKIKFTIIRRVLAPVLLVFVKLLMRTWRIRVQNEHCWDEWKRGDRRIAVAVFHGSFFCSIGTYYTLTPRRKSRLVNMVSPSQDGQLLGDIMTSFDMDAVSGSPRSRGAAGLLELIDEVKAGKVAILAVDGPRGPRGIPREGIFTLATATDARVYTFVPHARSALRFKSWDRAELPLPFSRIDVVIDCVFDVAETPLPPNAPAVLQRHMLETMERLGADTAGIERLSLDGDPPC